ncbi:hypothetical protein INT45_001770 [Circinella minor]|uniref:Uncharacterized protein n=1 Tax=Circinella minor TaxID=1195481 RepID=A0A8H7RVX1_9FUNG|nr:hypothetical protein INT45_001770 [Circinella minor]
MDELNVDQQRRALDFLVQLKSRSIQSIIFSYRDDMKNSFDNLLACTGYSITHIDINVQHSPEYFLEHLLIRCPNIESIKHTTGISPGRFFSRTLLSSRRPSIHQPQQQQQQQQRLIETNTETIMDKQQLKRIKLKSLYLKNVTSTQHILNGDIDIPNIEYISFFSSSKYQIKHIKQQGWAHLCYLHFNELYLAEEGVISLAAAIPNIPLLISLVFNNNCYFATQTNELFSAIGNLEHLEELCIMDKQMNGRVSFNDNLSSPQIHVNEEGYLALLNGKCRQTLRKLKLHPIAVLTNRMLAAIPNNHHHQQYSNGEQQQRLTCIDINQLYKEQSEEQVLTNEGLCAFASTMSCFKMDFIKIKSGPDSIHMTALGNNVCRDHYDIEISDTGKWNIYSLVNQPRKFVKCI